MEAKISDLEKLEEIILEYKSEQDQKRKRILYLNLVQESLKLVKRIVLGMYPLPGSIAKDDLIQVGAVGVLKAIDTYEPEERGSFKTYVSKFIKGKILHYLRDKANLVKTPRETIANLSKVKNAIEDLSAGTSKVPSAEEVAAFINMPKEKVEEIMNAELIKNMISLDQNIYSSEGTETLLDRIQADDNTSYEETFENKKIIEFALNKLPHTDKTVVYQYYMEGCSRREISQLLGVSPTQVSRILKRALNKLYIIIENEMTDKTKETIKEVK
ncbi:sigma-70 family RNA polymerase sigma factor [bacterium]|nr:sigma-70 family RNA polymerase sigma factor [bacterium]